MKAKINGFEVEGTPQEIVTVLGMNTAHEYAPGYGANMAAMYLKQGRGKSMAALETVKQVKKQKARVSHYRHWTPADDRLLRRLYRDLRNGGTKLPRNGARQIAKVLGRSATAVHQRSSELGLTKVKG